MSLAMIGLIGVVVLFVLIFLNMPVGLTLALVGFLGFIWVRGMEGGLSVLSTDYFRTASTYAFSVIPLFVAMGFIASETRLSADGYYTVDKWVGHLRGGLAMSATMACAIFAAICGDAIATACTVASVSLPQMRKRRYSDVLSLGCLAAGGNLGFLIPPSIGFIVYGIFTEESIGTLFIAGILPGILLTILFIFAIWVRCRMNPELGPASSPASWGERFASLRHIIGPAIVIVMVLGGIYAGIFTPTEAGAAGCFGVIVVGLIYRRMSLKGLSASLNETARLTGKIFVLVTGAIIFSRFLTVTEVALWVANFMASLTINRYLILALVIVFYMAIGFIMDIMSIVVITAPVIHPALVGLGFDGIWIGVLVMITILMGNITPPVGIVVFGLAGYVTDVSTWTIFRGVWPFVYAMIACIVILVAFPIIAMFLPDLMRIPLATPSAGYSLISSSLLAC